MEEACGGGVGVVLGVLPRLIGWRGIQHSYKTYNWILDNCEFFRGQISVIRVSVDVWRKH